MTGQYRRPTPEQAAWLKSFLGIDISLYADANEPSTDAPSASPPVGQAAAIDPKRAEQWKQQNKAAIDALQAAVHRVVLPGPAALAQQRLSALQNDMNAALQAGRLDAAAAALKGAQADVAVVMAPQDAAMVPVTPGRHPDQVLFGKETPVPGIRPGPADDQDIELTDVNQQGTGDCFMLSVLADVAKIKPDMIRAMVKPSGEGVYTVTFHRRKDVVSVLWAMISGGDQFEPVDVTVDSNFGTNTANSGRGQAQVGNQHEIWVQVVEKAFAKLNGGYDKITKGGYPQDAMETVTGRPAGSRPLAQVTVSDLQAALAGHQPVIMSTIKSSAVDGSVPNGMIGSHAYVLDLIQSAPDGQPLVLLKNPWGTLNPKAIPYNRLGQSVGWVQTGGAL